MRRVFGRSGFHGAARGAGGAACASPLAGLRAVHVNHHLQPAARAMARAARASARRLGVRCQVLDAPVRVARGESPEAAARAVRYAALRAQLKTGEWLLLAQHQDDQVESLLLQLLRGAGVAGLAAMPAKVRRDPASAPADPAGAVAGVAAATVGSAGSTTPATWMSASPAISCASGSCRCCVNAGRASASH